jgi:hypothetical protein
LTIRAAVSYRAGSSHQESKENGMDSNLRIILLMMMLIAIGAMFLALGQNVVALVVFGIAMVGLVFAAVRVGIRRKNR